MSINLVCPNSCHLNKQITWLCINPNCSKGHLLCSMCLCEHDDCADFLLRIEDIMTGNLSWIPYKNIQETLSLMENYGIKEDNEKLLKIFEERITQEFGDIIIEFTQKVNEAKDKIIQNARQLLNISGFDFKLFHEKLDSVYNINSFKMILQDSELEEKSFETINQELKTYFKQQTPDGTKIEELQSISKTINSFTQRFVELDKILFFQLKTTLPLHFQLFDEYPLVANMLEWDSTNKSKTIVLSNYNKCAHRGFLHPVPDNKEQVVLGNKQMSRGSYKWAFETKRHLPSSGKIQPFWLCFGVIDVELVKDMEEFPYWKGYAISTSEEAFNTEIIRRIYMFGLSEFHLDMEEGTFTILQGGIVIAKQSSSLKGKNVVPFVCLRTGGMFVELVMP